jgi:hypothetical protein
MILMCACLQELALGSSGSRLARHKALGLGAGGAAMSIHCSFNQYEHHFNIVVTGAFAGAGVGQQWQPAG